MQIGGTESISHSAQATFLALRDQQQALVRHLPNIEALSVLERNETPPTTRLYSRWQGSAGEIPAVLRPLISREMLAWFDEAVWHAETLSCQWRLESAKARDIFTCKGTTVLLSLIHISVRQPRAPRCATRCVIDRSSTRTRPPIGT